MTTTTNGRIPKLVHVTSVEVLHDRVVHLTFTDGCEGDLDLGSALTGRVFGPLADNDDLFRAVRVDPEARTLVWPNGADMAPEMLHLEAATDCPHRSVRPRHDLTPGLGPKPKSSSGPL